MKNKTLPDLPSELITLALNDLEKVEKMKTRKVNMYEWYELRDGVYYVCLAGAVMDRTLNITPTSSAAPLDLIPKFRNKLFALNAARRGNISVMFYELNISDLPKEFLFYREIPEYKGKGTEFKKAMRQLAQDLKDKGY